MSTVFRKKLIEQIVENCKFWNSTICKTETVLKYAKDKGVENPEEILADLTHERVVYEPKPGYIGLTNPEKYGLIGEKKSTPEEPSKEVKELIADVDALLEEMRA